MGADRISTTELVAWLRKSSERYFAAWGRDNRNGRYLAAAADELERLSRLSGNGGGAERPEDYLAIEHDVGAATPSASLEEVTEELAEALKYVLNRRASEMRHAHIDGGNTEGCARCVADNALFRYALTSSAAPQAQAAPPPNLEPQCGVGEELDPFETWFASLPRGAQQRRFQHSLYMREAWNAAMSTLPASVAAPKPIDDGAVET